jgi:ATP-dependent Clp protease protease subunit
MTKLLEQVLGYQKIQADMERDFFLDAEEAKAYGLIDQVIAKRP